MQGDCAFQQDGALILVRRGKTSFGNHGRTIASWTRTTLFYFESRGISAARGGKHHGPAAASSWL